MRASGAEVLLRLVSHEAASTILAPASSLSLSRSFARKADGKSAKGMSRGKTLPESQQLKLPEQTLQNFSRMLDPNWQPALGADGGVTPEEAEEWRQAQRKYSRLKMAELRAWQHRMQGLIRMKKEALEALPPALRAEAEKPDDAPFPLLRWIATHTPPVAGYQERVLGLEEAATQTELGVFFGGQKRR